MRKFIGVILFTLFTSPAWAGVSCTLPFNFTPGSIADANQVMANYNALVTCLGNAATAGINNDITALTGLTTPISPAVGGTNSYNGGTAGGTANAITVASTTPANWTLTVNNRVTFLASGSNTGITSLAVGATSALNLVRLTPGGLASMAGGEIVSGQSVTAVYDGIEYQMVSQMALDYPPGAVFDYASASGCPVGSLEATGSTLVSQTTFPTLFGVLGTTWGAATGGNFTIPDLRGRATYSRDSSLARITVGGGNFDGSIVGNAGGAQNRTLVQGNLPNVNFKVTAGQWTPSITVTPDPNLFRAGTGFGSGGSAGWATVPGVTPSFSASSDSNPQMNVASGGSGSALATLSNAAIVLKCIRG